ncbi:YHS domain-containing protein [Ruegeria halocynthiae]|uniref:YHS domain-containing protein n=1 Tax=Ruegeria halocynthiae TaxID=985054 RepID=A0A1H2YI96_9RHOB|nr:YHS domain-containing (seleno)protein [Ruegeria halocynthiae]SDX04344.1 YHS domain-containing protein [Ruegeria halocynthiae]
MICHGILKTPGKVLAASIMFGIGAITPASAEELLNTHEGVAMDGFDVVAYFSENAPAVGLEQHAITYKGSEWLFSSAENAAAFESSPEKYAPQFNGFCSYAVSEGYGAEVDFIKGWAVLDGKLYLNWNEETKDEFVAEHTTRVGSAESAWPAVHSGIQDGSVPLYRHADEPTEGISHPQTQDFNG